MHEELYELLANFVEMEEEDLQRLKDYFYPRRFKRGEIIVKEGQLCDSILYISSGFFRVYLVNDAEEFTVHLAGNRDFVTSFSSFISRTPSQEYVEALTDAEGLCVSYADLQELYKSSGRWEKIGRHTVETLFVRKENRVISFIQQTAEERYDYLMEHRPDIIQHVPLKYIASFIGVKPETLSRIRAKFS